MATTKRIAPVYGGCPHHPRCAHTWMCGWRDDLERLVGLGEVTRTNADALIQKYLDDRTFKPPTS